MSLFCKYNTLFVILYKSYITTMKTPSRMLQSAQNTICRLSPSSSDRDISGSMLHFEFPQDRALNYAIIHLPNALDSTPVEDRFAEA